ncbi:MAG: hypothetical protein AB8G86_19330 [Saprospiraceae bacterium]
MKFGIIAEGRSDCAVIKNILRGLDLIEMDDDVQFLRPRFNIDAMDIAKREIPTENFSNWTLVKKDCEEGLKLREFFDLENPFGEDRAIIIQIDTAECEDVGYDVVKPNKKEATYCDDLRAEVIAKIQSWINKPEIADQLFFAVCIEETEAWVHALYESKNTANFPDPKRAFDKYRSKKSQTDKKFQKSEQKLVNKNTFEKFNFYSKDFQKRKKLNASLKNNKSLADFVADLSKLAS